MIKLGNYRRVMEELRKKHELKRIEVEVLLFAQHIEWFSQYDACKGLSASDKSIKDAMARLTGMGYTKIAREYKPKLCRKYVMTRKARSLVIMFNTKMFNV